MAEIAGNDEECLVIFPVLLQSTIDRPKVAGGMTDDHWDELEVVPSGRGRCQLPVTCRSSRDGVRRLVGRMGRSSCRETEAARRRRHRTMYKGMVGGFETNLRGESEQKTDAPRKDMSDIRQMHLQRMFFLIYTRLDRLKKFRRFK